MIASLFCLFSVRSTVVMAIENVLARIESIFDYSTGDVFSTVVRHPAASEIVGRSSRRALTGVIEMGCIAGFNISVVWTRFTSPAGTSYPVESSP